VIVFTEEESYVEICLYLLIFWIFRYAAGTQSHPTYARRIAPCFDEPEYKAVWKLQIIHPVGTTAIANGIEIVDAAKTYLL
jgi:aminopeptidase N